MGKIADVSKESKRSCGTLKLKGHSITKDVKEKSKSKSKRHKTDEPRRQRADLEVVSGSGRIVSSGVTVHGFETAFQEEIKPGDVIIVLHPQTLVEEDRIVVSALSQRSLTIDRPFSSDLVSTRAFRIRKESLLLEEQAEREAKDSLQKNGGAIVEGATNASLVQDAVSRKLQEKIEKVEKTVSYRQKTGMWGYKVVTETVEGDRSAEELLEARIKKVGRDKFCW